MNNKRTVINPFAIRIVGAIVGAIGFLLLTYRVNIFGTALIGIGSLLIVAGEK